MSKTDPQKFQFVPHYNLLDSFWDLFVCLSKQFKAYPEYLMHAKSPF